MTQRYGETCTSAFHTGIDFACPMHTNILASAPGTVMFAAWDPTGYGNMVIIRHGDGRATLYAHLSLISVAVGHIVYQGEKIGESGSTGNSTGPHLHFEARTKWNDYRTHFDPIDLPLQNFVDLAPDPQKPAKLKEPDELGEMVEVVCRDGARVFNKDWSMKYAGFPQGTKLHFTGKTEKRPAFPEYTYCEVYEEPKKYWVAVHDGRTQILDNSG